MDTAEEIGSVALSRTRYNELIEAEKILHKLYAGGVDNWEWYEGALVKKIKKELGVVNVQ